MDQEFVTLVNRTTRILTYVYDGRGYELLPGENPRISWRHVPYAKNQNPIMGTQHPISLRTQYFVGVVGTKDPIDPIDERKIHAVELLDRSKMPRHLQKVESFDRGGVPEETSSLAGISASNITETGFSGR